MRDTSATKKVHHSRRLSQRLLERLPIVRFPSRRQVFPLALGKARMVKHDHSSGALFHELELRNRVDAWFPATRSPGLDDSLVRHQIDVPSHDIAAEKCERASHFTANLRGLASCGHGIHDSAELYDLVELFGVGECFVDVLPARFENSLLVNGFRRTRNLLLGSRPSLG